MLKVSQQVRAHTQREAYSKGKGKASVEANFMNQYDGAPGATGQQKEAPAPRRKVKTDFAFKHAKPIKLFQRYDNGTPPPLMLEKEEDAKIEQRDGKVGYAYQRKNRASKKMLENPFQKEEFQKSPRSTELNEFLEDNFADKKAYSARQNKAKPLILTTPFVIGGFIDKEQLKRDPNNVFEMLGLEKGLKEFKFQGQTVSVKKQTLITAQKTSKVLL